jgi:hypothetical protein
MVSSNVKGFVLLRGVVPEIAQNPSCAMVLLLTN